MPLNIYQPVPIDGGGWSASERGPSVDMLGALEARPARTASPYSPTWWQSVSDHFTAAGSLVDAGVPQALASRAASGVGTFVSETIPNAVGTAAGNAARSVVAGLGIPKTLLVGVAILAGLYFLKD